MSRLFYHTMQDNAGNLLFDVSGTMRIAGSGTLATIYGDEGLTVILPNPMTNHPSFGSFKCFLGAGDYDFYMAKSGYTFETLTGVQGHGTMAQQDASAVAITGGTAILSGLDVNAGTARRWTADIDGIRVADFVTTPANQPLAFIGAITDGANRYNCYMEGAAPNYFQGKVTIGAPTPMVDAKVSLIFDKSALHAMVIQQAVSDVAGNSPIVFKNMAAAIVGYIATNATTTTYNTTSDVRLKHAIAPLTGALDVVRALRPVKFLWNADDSAGVGFLAGEVQEVIPDGVITGERDAVDDEGRIIPQMIDYSKLVPWLVGAIQTLTARLAVLEDALGV